MKPVLKRMQQLIMDQGLQIAVAESVTGGRVQSLLTSISGASQCFRGGLTAYQLDEKIKLLGVDQTCVYACQGVSQQVAEQMAIGACRLFDADAALATTGYAEADESQHVATPRAWLSVARRINRNGQFELTAIYVETTGNRVEAQEHFADRAISLLLEALETGQGTLD